jgi:hypothetical protein
MSAGLKMTYNEHMVRVKLKKQKLSTKTYLVFANAQVIVTKTMILPFMGSM